MSGSDARFVGVDWAIGGWFSIGFDADGRCEFRFGRFADLAEHYRKATLILVDIPIGLPCGEYERRRCDGEARDYVRKRLRSVFWTPPRFAVERSYRAKANGVTPEEHKNILLELNASRPKGEKLTIQAWNIAPMIAEVDAVLRSPSFQGLGSVREVHPEVCFRALSRGKAVAPKKAGQRISPEGMEQRIQILGDFEPRAREIYDLALARYSQQAAPDDILDALAAVLTAQLGYPDKLRTLPANPPKDEYGLPMEMVFYNPTS